MTMTPGTQAQPNSALELLLGSVDHVTGLMALLSVDSSGELGRSLENLPAEIRGIAGREVSAAAAGLLNINLIDLLVEGWREYADLTSAARRTLAAPGTSELVSLMTHRVSAEQEPHVDLLVDGRLVATVRFGFSDDFDVSAMVAAVRRGILVAVHAGRCDITATLAINGVDVVTKQARVELPGAIPLTPGIRLLSARDYAAAEAVGERADRAHPKLLAGTVLAAAGSDATGKSRAWWKAAATSATRTAAAPGTAGSPVRSSATPDDSNEETNSASQRSGDPSGGNGRA